MQILSSPLQLIIALSFQRCLVVALWSEPEGQQSEIVSHTWIERWEAPCYRSTTCSHCIASLGSQELSSPQFAPLLFQLGASITRWSPNCPLSHFHSLVDGEQTLGQIWDLGKLGICCYHYVNATESNWLNRLSNQCELSFATCLIEDKFFFSKMDPQDLNLNVPDGMKVINIWIITLG